MTDLKIKVDDVERERDFYFDKLRDIEILCQTPEVASVPVSPCNLPLPTSVLKVHLCLQSSRKRED